MVCVMKIHFLAPFPHTQLAHTIKGFKVQFLHMRNTHLDKQLENLSSYIATMQYKSCEHHSYYSVFIET